MDMGTLHIFLYVIFLLLHTQSSDQKLEIHRQPSFKWQPGFRRLDGSTLFNILEL